MKSSILIGFCFALALVEVHAEGENEVTRGLYPFMAFIYYPDETVVDSTGSRFVRGAVLIRPDWLVSSAIGPNILNGFPRKTLLARAGAITIDANFTLNEDEYEQEREVIQIVRPYNHSATQWWRTDISLMKTLLPFNLTNAVGISTMNPKHDYMEKTCIILVYVRRFGNWTEDKLLMQIFVEFLPPSITNCGNHFVGNTMTCAADSDENKNFVYDPKFCQGNSGGPLICEGEVMGLQTYIDNDCKQPHLYQLLTAWDNFISCGTENKCQEEECAYICDIANKDAPTTQIVTSIEEIKSVSEYTVATSINTTMEPISPTASTEDLSTQLTSKTTEALRSNTNTETSPKTTVSSTTELKPNTTSEAPTTTEAEPTDDTAETRQWPKQKDDDKKIDYGDLDIERKPTVEAQRHDGKVKTTNVAPSNVAQFRTLIFEFFIMASLI